jgi:hypothetical protein
MEGAVFFVFHRQVTMGLDTINELLNDRGDKTTKG